MHNLTIKYPVRLEHDGIVGAIVGADHELICEPYSATLAEKEEMVRMMNLGYEYLKAAEALRNNKVNPAFAAPYGQGES